MKERHWQSKISQSVTSEGARCRQVAFSFSTQIIFSSSFNVVFIFCKKQNLTLVGNCITAILLPITDLLSVFRCSPVRGVLCLLSPPVSASARLAQQKCPKSSRKNQLRRHYRHYLLNHCQTWPLKFSPFHGTFFRQSLTPTASKWPLSVKWLLEASNWNFKTNVCPATPAAATLARKHRLAII